MANASPICSDEVARAYLRLIRHRLRRWKGHPMADDLTGYVAWKVFDTLARLKKGSAEEAFGVVAMITKLASRSFWHSQHCDPAWRQGGPADHWQEVSLTEAANDDQWLRRFIEPDFAPRLIERLYAEAVWEELAPLLREKEQVVVTRWLAGERICEIARDLGLVHRVASWRFQAALDQYRLRHELRCRELAQPGKRASQPALRCR